jgi:hypothetical protein
MSNAEKQAYVSAMGTFSFLGTSSQRAATNGTDQLFVTKSSAQAAQVAAIKIPAVNEEHIRSIPDSFGHHARPAAAVNTLAVGIAIQQSIARSNSL